MIVAEGSLWILTKQSSTVGRRYQQGSWLLVNLGTNDIPASSILQM